MRRSRRSVGVAPHLGRSASDDLLATYRLYSSYLESSSARNLGRVIVAPVLGILVSSRHLILTSIRAAEDLLPRRRVVLFGGSTSAVFCRKHS